MSEERLRLIDYYILRGELRCITGLHIGAGNDTLEIGGTDRPVIKHPIEDYPYIPGSSLKGKLRSLLEMRYGAFAENGGPSKTQAGNHGFVGRIFGINAGEEEAQTPTALLMRDAIPAPDYLADLTQRRRAGQIVFESKSENSINRITAEANPRTIERVPAGAGFAFEAMYRVFACNGDNGTRSRDDFAHLLEALALLQLDTLGGHGSRGYGRVEFAELHCADIAGNAVELKTLAEYLVMAAGS